MIFCSRPGRSWGASRQWRKAGGEDSSRPVHETLTLASLVEEETGIDEKRLLCLANCADRMRIKGLGKEYAAILPAVGVDTVKELKYRNPEKLAKALAEANKKRKLVGVLPSDRAIVRWIEYAKRLPLKITY